MKVFLDTNVLASALTTRGLCADLFEALLLSQELLTSDAVLQELSRVLPEKLGLSPEITQEFLELISAEATLVTVETDQLLHIPDPDDEPIIVAALAGEADLFVTGDKALLKLGNVKGLPICSPRQVWEALSKA